MTIKDDLIVGACNNRADQHKEDTLKRVYAMLLRLAEREVSGYNAAPKHYTWWPAIFVIALKYPSFFDICS